jgi:hypothetical protein
MGAIFISDNKELNCSDDAEYKVKQKPPLRNLLTGGFYIQPRVIRLRDAPDYLGMDKNRFNNEVRPYVIEVPMGAHGVAFDKLDLDAWWEDYKLRTGRSKSSEERIKTWDKPKLEPKASIRKLMDQKQSVKHGKENVSLIGSGEPAKSKRKPGYTTKLKNENAISNVEKALAICLQSAQRSI